MTPLEASAEIGRARLTAQHAKEALRQPATDTDDPRVRFTTWQAIVGLEQAESHMLKALGILGEIQREQAAA